MKKYAIWAVGTLAILLTACGGSDFKKSPIDTLIRDMDNEDDFTVILYDMDVEGIFFEDYKHQYKVVKPDDSGKPVEKVTDWIEVDERTFNQYVNDMGMEIASKKDGKVSKAVAPPGYSNYVGNSQYGQWKTDSSGNSFWAFYGQYMFMSNMLGLFGGPVYRRGYSDYRDNYSRSGRPYYGGYNSNGVPRYGTSSTAVTKQNPRFASRVNSNSSFRSKVGDRVSRSSGSSTIAGKRSSSYSGSNSGQTSRSGSRYGSSSSSSRSRSSSRGGK